MNTLRQTLRTSLLAAAGAATAGAFLLTAVLFATLLLPVDAGAQATVQEGDLVRVRTHDGGTAVGVFRGVEGVVVHLGLQNGEPEDLRVLPLTGVRRVERRVHRTSGGGAAHGALVGFSVGAVGGAALGYAGGSGTDCTAGWGVGPCFTRGDQAIMGGVTLGLLGAVVGAVVGAVRPGEAWQRAVIRQDDEVAMRGRTRWTVAPAAGGVRIGVEMLR